MTYDATIKFEFNSTISPSLSSIVCDEEFTPEEHFVLTAPASELTTKQCFRLFEKFLFACGYELSSIKDGAMSLVFNEWVTKEQQRKVCDEYDLTMNEDLDSKFKEWKKLNEQIKEAQSHFVTYDKQ